MNRSFLERSLADLDREFEAGDLTPEDYERLRAEYEARLRGEERPSRPPPKPAFVVAAVAFVVVVAVAAGVLVAQSMGRREDGTAAAGPPPEAAAEPAIAEELARCRTLDASEAIDCYRSYRDANPDDPDGYVQFGLFSIALGIQNDRDELVDAGESFLRRGLELDPGHVEARVNLAVVLNRTGRQAEADAECAVLAEADVPPDLAPLVDLACTP